MNGTLINYYIHCKRQCYLFYNKLNLEDNSELVSIGSEIHKSKFEDIKNSEVRIENISVDKITKDYVVEFKKSDADLEAAKWQLIYYLYILSNKGIVKKGKLQFYEKRGKPKIEIIELNENNTRNILEIINDIERICNSENVPERINQAKCKKCAYYEYCYI